MLYSQQRHTLRNMFLETWHKYQQGLTLAPLEQNIAAIIQIHPEFHEALAQSESVLEKNYHPELGEVNPFLHLSLHLTILDQVKTNRPQGIADIYTRLVKKYTDEHIAAHRMMNVLADALWLAQKNKTQPDEVAYYLALSALT